MIALADSSLDFFFWGGHHVQTKEKHSCDGDREIWGWANGHVTEQMKKDSADRMENFIKSVS